MKTTSLRIIGALFVLGVLWVTVPCVRADDDYVTEINHYVNRINEDQQKLTDYMNSIQDGIDQVVKQRDDLLNRGTDAQPDRGMDAQPEAPPMPKADVAQIDLALPADAQLWIQGVKMTQTGAMRRFVSPRLDPEESYNYEIKAAYTENGKEVTVTRRLDLRAGDRKSVLFQALPLATPKAAPMRLDQRVRQQIPQTQLPTNGAEGPAPTDLSPAGQTLAVIWMSYFRFEPILGNGLLVVAMTVAGSVLVLLHYLEQKRADPSTAS